MHVSDVGAQLKDCTHHRITSTTQHAYTNLYTRTHTHILGDLMMFLLSPKWTMRNIASNSQLTESARHQCILEMSSLNTGYSRYEQLCGGGFVLILALWFIIDILQSLRLNSSSISLLLFCIYFTSKDIQCLTFCTLRVLK